MTPRQAAEPRVAGETDEQRKARQRREVAAYEKANGLVPGTAQHRGDGPAGGASGGIEWEGRARMAAGRLVARAADSRRPPIDADDAAALRRHPEHLPHGFALDDLEPATQETPKAALTAPGTLERHDARPTSTAAARRALGASGGARARVLAAVAAEPRTDEELQGDLRMPANTQRPRRVECEEAGWLEDSGQRRPTASGADAIVWRVTSAGLLALDEAGIAP